MWAEEEETTIRTPLVYSSSSDEYGKPYDHDPEWQGTEKDEKRGCNDIIFLIAFALMMVAMISVSVYAFAAGDPYSLHSSSWFAEQGVAQLDSWLQDAMYDLKQNVWIIVGTFLFAILLAVVWMQLMKYFTKIFIYITFALGLLAFTVAGAWLIYEGVTTPDTLCIIFGAAFLLVMVVLACIMFFLRKKIALTCVLIKEACKGIEHNPMLWGVAAIVLLFFGAFCTFWTIQMVFLCTIPSGETIPVVNNDGVETVVTFFSTNLANLIWFQLFGLFWVCALISNVFQMVVAGAISHWYFSRDMAKTSQATGSPALVTLARATTKSLGTLALGALVLAIVEFVNFVLERVKKANASNIVARMFLCCLQCCLGCVHSILSFINKFTIIYVAMHGKNFFRSAVGCFRLIRRNLFSAVIADSIGDFVTLVGRLLCTALCVLLAIVLGKYIYGSIHSVTIGVVAVTSYCLFLYIAHMIDVGLDTVFVCYMEDLERNKGALMCSPDLHNLLQTTASELNKGSEPKN